MTLSCDPTLRGQRSKYVIFSKFSKCYSSYRLHRMVMWLMHVNKLDPLYKGYIHNLDLGSQGSKVDFHQKCYKSSMLYSMTIRVIHVYKLETFYSCCGSQVNQGSFDVIGVKSVVWCPLLQHIKLSMVSCWMGDHIKLSKVSSWLGDHISRHISLNT